MECFRSLLVPQIAKLKEPIYSTLDEVYQELLELAAELNNKVFYRFPDLLSIVTEVTCKKLGDLKEQTESTLDTLIEGEMCTVFTNDARYVSARDDLLAVNMFLFRKQQIMTQAKQKTFLLGKSEKGWMGTSESSFMSSMIVSLRLLAISWWSNHRKPFKWFYSMSLTMSKSFNSWASLKKLKSKERD